MRVVYWGTYDKGKPRNRILLEGLRLNGVEVTEINYDLWNGVEDKSQIFGISRKLLIIFRWVFSYPRLIYRFITLPRNDAIVIGYLGHLDVLAIWLFAKLKRTPVVWDAFISLYDTVIFDRKIINRFNPFSILLYCGEWLSCRAADQILLDTEAHARLFRDLYKVSGSKVKHVFVGMEPDKFLNIRTSEIVKCARKNKTLTVLFYGEFIPLHGVDTIFSAAKLLEQESIEWMIIGKGQEAGKMQNYLKKSPVDKLFWKEWVEYEELANHISQADICLGIFGNSAKAANVIPNKVYQIIASRKPLITRDSPAIRELISREVQGVLLVSPASPAGLADAVLRMAGTLDSLPGNLHEDIIPRFMPEVLGKNFKNHISEVLE